MVKVAENNNPLGISHYIQRLAISSVRTADAAQQIIDFDKMYGYYHDLSKSENANYSNTFSIYEALRNENLAEPIQLYGFIINVSETSIVELPNSEGVMHQVDTFHFGFHDVEENFIGSFELPRAQFAKEIFSYCKNQTPILLRGTIISEVEKGYGQYRFYFKEASFEITPLNIIQCNNYSMEDLKRKVELYNDREGGIRKFIKDTLVENIGIKGLEHGTHIDKAIDFMILQSLSRGMSKDGRYSNKLHSLVIGPPAVGKNLLIMIAKILNPVAYELMSSGKKITPAGLIGNVIRRAQEVISNPGYLPRASHGIVLIQDFHEVIKTNQDVWGIFSKVMEDGEVVDSTSARAVHSAITSIHIDMNKKSQLGISTAKGNDVDIPSNIISRFDFIMDIPADFERQFEIVLDMAKGEKILSTSLVKGPTPDWQLMLRRIIAYLSTVYDTAKIGQTESEYIVAKLKTIAEANKEYAHMLDDAAGILTRFYNSIEKLAKVIACINLRFDVTVDDIEEAFEFIVYKLDYISKENSLNVPTLTQKELTVKERVQNKILELFKEKELSIQEMVPELNKNLPNPTNARSVDRYMKDLQKEGLAEKVGYAKWKVKEPQKGKNT